MKSITIKKTMMLALLACVTSNANAQTKWNYTYDNAGNRTVRQVTTGSKARQRSSTGNSQLIKDGHISAVIDKAHTTLKIEALRMNGSPMDISVYDTSGKELIYRNANSEVTVIDISHLQKGVYILSIDLNGEKKSCKFNK